MKKVIHINQHKIKQNRKTGTREPVITCKTYKTNEYGNYIILYDDHMIEIGRVVYSPNKPLKCGSECWLEYNGPIEIIK